MALRDLDSSKGTFVNGQNVSHIALKDGDILSVGPFQFRVSLSSSRAPEMEPATRDPIRLQSAAVAAQQVALTEEESKLAQRRTALEKQEEQLSAHLEDKRLKLLHLSERAQAERAALDQDRMAYERHVEKVTGDMTAAQRDFLAQQQKIENERSAWGHCTRRLRQRWHRFWLAERKNTKPAKRG